VAAALADSAVDLVSQGDAWNILIWLSRQVNRIKNLFSRRIVYFNLFIYWNHNLIAQRLYMIRFDWMTNQIWWFFDERNHIIFTYLGVLSLADRYIALYSPNYPVGRSRLEAISVLACASIMIMASIEVTQYSVVDLIKGFSGSKPLLNVDKYMYIILGK
jgi:hypothetical protein